MVIRLISRRAVIVGSVIVMMVLGYAMSSLGPELEQGMGMRVIGASAVLDGHKEHGQGGYHDDQEVSARSLGWLHSLTHITPAVFHGRTVRTSDPRVLPAA